VSLKRKDTPENRAYWAFVERVAKECRRTPAGPPCVECWRELNDLSVSTIGGTCNRCCPAWAAEVIIG
jgi:hypothetical protein